MMKRILLGLLCASMSLCAVAQNRVTKVLIPGARGLLAAEVQMPENKGTGKCPITILAHGFGGDKNWQLMKLVSDSLQMHGIASIRFDFNGHGESEGDFKDMTVPNEIEDLKRVVRYALQLDGCNGKIGLLGHSQGGVVVSMTACAVYTKFFLLGFTTPFRRSLFWHLQLCCVKMPYEEIHSGCYTTPLIRPNMSSFPEAAN